MEAMWEVYVEYLPAVAYKALIFMAVHPISVGHVLDAMSEALSLQSAVYETGPPLMAPLIWESRNSFTSSLSVLMYMHCLQSSANAETMGGTF